MSFFPLFVWHFQKNVVTLYPQLRKILFPLLTYREVEQLVARQAHNLEVACSSPALATKYKDNNLIFRLLSFRLLGVNLELLYSFGRISRICST